MKNYKYILFDLDGTITNPGMGITNSVMYSLKKFGITVSDRKDLYKFIGPPLLDSFQKYYGFSMDESVTAVKYYREYYRDKGIFENFVYEGLNELLYDLKDSGKTMLVATSKPEYFARQIIDYFGLSDYFIYVAGSNLDGTRVDKYEVIRYALESTGIYGLSEVIMIGDREYDVLGAKKMGVSSMGVLFGYGSEEEIIKSQPDYVAETVADIGKILL